MERHDGPAATGEPSVDGAIRRLDDLDAAPLDEHVTVFDEVHRLLHDALTELDRT
jgi:hypothetical protein